MRPIIVDGDARQDTAHTRYHERGLLGFLVLVSLTEGDAHGYEVMKRIEKITAGYWKPAPGSLYPVIDSLEKEGLIECYSVEVHGKQRRMCKLTNEGYQVLVELLNRKIKVYTYVLEASLKAYVYALKKLGLSSRKSKCLAEVLELIEKAKELLSNCTEG